MNGSHAGARYFVAQVFAPNLIRDELALQNTQKVERGVRLQTALKANKVDLRSLLALPVTDPAHPYRSEFPWEKAVARMDSRAGSMYSKWYKTKTMASYEAGMYHKFGVYVDDRINARGWWNRAARTRAPQVLVNHMDRRIVRGRHLKDKYLYARKEEWVSPVDNTAFFSPYCTMVADEWEEKWGFFAGQEVEY